MPAGAGQIFVDLLLQTQAFEQKMNTTLNQIKQFGTHTTDLSTSVTKVDQAFGTTATKMQDLATKTGQLSQKTQELKPKEDAAAQGATELGNKAQKAGTDLQTMGTKSDQAGSRLSKLGTSFKQSALAVAGFSTSLFNTYMQYDSIKDQELTLERTRLRLADETTNIANAQRDLNIAIKEENISNEDAIIKQNEIDENLANLKIKQELYTDAVQDHANAWRGFALSLAPTVITGLASIQAFMSKTGTSAVAATTGVKTFGGGVGAMMLRVAPFTLAIGAIVAAFLAIKNNTFGARDSLQAFGKSLGDAMPILQPVLIFIEQLGGFLGLAGEKSGELRTQFMETIGAMGAAITGFGQSIISGVTGFKDWITELITYAQQSGDYAGAIEQLVDDIKENFFNFLTFAQTDIVPAVTSFITTFQTEVIARLPDLLTAIIAGISGAWTWTTDVIDTIWQAFVDEVTTWFDSNSQGMVEDWIQAILDAFGWDEDTIDEIWKAFADEVETWFDENAEGMVETWIKSILKAFGWKQEDIDAAMEGFTKFMKTWAEDPKKALGDLGAVIAGKIVAGLIWTGEVVAKEWNKVMPGLLTQFAVEVGKINFEAIGVQIGGAVVTAINWAASVISALLTNKWGEFLTEAEKQYATQKDAPEMTKMGNSIATAIVESVQFIPEMFSGFWTGFFDALIRSWGLEDQAAWMQKIWNSVNSGWTKGAIESRTTEPTLTVPEGESALQWEGPATPGMKVGQVLKPGTKTTTTYGPPLKAEEIGQLVDILSAGGPGGVMKGAPALGSAIDYVMANAGPFISNVGDSVTKGMYEGWKLTQQPSLIFPEAGGEMMSDAQAKQGLTQMIDAALLGYKPGGYPTVTNPYEGLPFNPDKQTIQYATLSNEAMAKINKDIFGKPGAFQFPYTAPESITQNATLPSRFTEEAVATRMGIGAEAGAGGPTDPAALATMLEEAAARIQAAFEIINAAITANVTMWQAWATNITPIVVALSQLIAEFAQNSVAPQFELLLTLLTSNGELWGVWAQSVTAIVVALSQLIASFVQESITPQFELLITLLTSNGELWMVWAESITAIVVALSELFAAFVQDSVAPQFELFITLLESNGQMWIAWADTINQLIGAIDDLIVGFVKAVEGQFMTFVDILTSNGEMWQEWATTINDLIGAIDDLIVGFVDITMVQTFQDKQVPALETVGESWTTWSETVSDSIDSVIDDIDELIDKLEELAEAQDEADSGGGGGGESELEWFGTGRYGLQFVTPSFRRGGSFISKKARKFRGANISEFDKWELVTVTPLSNPSNDQDKNSRVREIAGAEEVNYSGGMARRQSPIIVNGTLNAVLVTPNGRELAKTSSPFILEYSEAQY